MELGKITQKRILVALLFLAFLIRLPGLFQLASIDEVGWLGKEFWMNWHPPLSMLIHSIFRLVLGDFVWVSRLLMMIVGLLNLFLVYRIAKMLFGDKAALFSAGVMAIGAYPLLASLQIDIDGSFLMLFYLLTTHFFLEYESSKKPKHLLLAGSSFGLCLLTKYPGLFILPILALYHLIKERKILSTLKIFSAISLIGLLVFGIYPLYSLLFEPELFYGTISHFSGYITQRGIDLQLLLIQYILPVIWAGPLFIGLFLLSLKKPKKEYLLPIIWIVLILLFYTLLDKDNFKPLERYLTALIAPFSLLIGSLLARFNPFKCEAFALGRQNKQGKDIKWTLVSLLVILCLSFALMMLLNSRGDILNFYPKTAFLQRAISLDWDFYLPIAGSSGPIGFYVNLWVVAIGFGISLLAVLGLLAIDWEAHRKAARLLFILFIGVCLSYNFFLIQEYLFGATAPNINKVTWQMLDYAGHNELAGPIYVFRNTAFRYYLGEKYGRISTFDFSIENDSTKVGEIIGSGGTVLIVDFPQLNKESKLWKEISTCSLIAEFEDKGKLIGYVFDCRK